jgi:hypothetical protein
MGNAMRKSILVAFLTALMVCGFALVSMMNSGTVKASTEVSGIISSDTTWTKSSSPYSLTGPVGVAEGVTLTIEPGTIVDFNTHYILVNGTFRAQGVNTEKIYLNDGYIIFTNAASGWNEQTGSGSVIENVDITALKVSTSGLPQAVKINSSSPKITNNFISGLIEIYGLSEPKISGNAIMGGILAASSLRYTISNNTIIQTELEWSEGVPTTLIDCLGGGGAAIYNNTVSGGTVGINGGDDIRDNTVSGSKFGISGSGVSTISDNIILDCHVGITSGLIIERNLIKGNGEGDGISTEGFVLIRNNTITNNQNGISIRSSGFGVTIPHIVNITNNNIYGNGEYNIYLKSSYNVNATYNWWGTTDTATINQKICDYNDDFNLGKVNYTPFLTEPNTQAMPDPNAPTPTLTPTPPPTDSPSTPAPSQEPQPTQIEAITGIAIAAAVLGAGLGLLVYLIKRK